MENKRTKTAIIGAGASGLMAALKASENSIVTVFEIEREPGKKLLGTGSGKCNITNLSGFEKAYYSGDLKKAMRIIGSFDNRAVMDFFDGIGLVLTCNGDYIYPGSGQAASVRDCLYNALDKKRVKFSFKDKITAIEKANTGYDIRTTTDNFHFDTVVIATGSYAGIKKENRCDSAYDGYSLAYHLGAKIVPVKPALSGIIPKDNISALAGVRSRGLASLFCDGKPVYREKGEIQFTDSSISGIPVMNLSHYVGRGDRKKNNNFCLQIDFFPEMGFEDFCSMISKREEKFKNKTILEFSTGLHNSKVMSYLMEKAKLSPEAKVVQNMEKLSLACKELKACGFEIKGIKQFEYAQCASGGVSLDSINDNCMLISSPGVFLCGEILDVDGICGGYNLQWAWSSGYVAGGAASVYDKNR